jgi:hypothetical protein
MERGKAWAGKMEDPEKLDKALCESRATGQRVAGGRYEGSGAKCASEIQNRYLKPCFMGEHSKTSVRHECNDALKLGQNMTGTALD